MVRPIPQDSVCFDFAGARSPQNHKCLRQRQARPRDAFFGVFDYRGKRSLSKLDGARRENV